MPYAEYHKKEKEKERYIKRKEEGYWKRYIHKKTYYNYIKKGRHANSTSIKRGEEHPNWQGGISPLSQRLRVCQKYKKWRMQILQRDKFTCQNCGNKKDALHIHHIISYSEIIRINKIDTFEKALLCSDLWNIDNGITFCLECHAKEDPIFNILKGGHTKKCQLQ